MTCSKSDEAAEERDLLVMQKNNKTVLFVPGSTDNPLDLSQWIIKAKSSGSKNPAHRILLLF